MNRQADGILYCTAGSPDVIEPVVAGIPRIRSTIADENPGRWYPLIHVKLTGRVWGCDPGARFWSPSWSHTFATTSLRRLFALTARLSTQGTETSLNPMEPSQVFAAQLLDTLPEAEIAEIQRRQNEM
jgi:hypothetical protein